MKLVGFTANKITNNALYKRVTRRVKSLMSPVAATTSIAVVSVLPNVSSVSTLTAASIPVAATPVLATPPNVTPTPLCETPPPKKHRHTVKELNCFHSKLNAEKEVKKLALKANTTWIKHCKTLAKGDPNKKTIRVIVKEVNDAYNDAYKANVSTKTTAAYVPNGMAGMSPLK
jgi:hypothetical protein